MLSWHEGEIIAYEDPLNGDEPVIRCTVRELTQNIEISGVQMPLRSGQQDKPKLGSIIAFYRDTAATAKFGFLLSDPKPIGSPIAIETAMKAAQDGEKVFVEGEVALSALGDDDGFNATEGGQLWLRNTGDAILASGSYQQRIMASDSSDSVDIQGSNIDIYAQGNLISTHFFNIDTQSFSGITSLALGLRNPVTGVYITRLKCDSFGAFTLGAEDPALGSLISGISYNLVPSLPLGPFIVPEVKLMSVPLLSQLTVNPLGTSINGPTINLAGPAALVGASAPATLVNILSALTQITGLVDIVGATAITGATFIQGNTAITGAVEITGATTITGNTAVIGAFETTANTINLIGIAVPTPSPILNAQGVQMIPFLLNGVVRNLLII